MTNDFCDQVTNTQATSWKQKLAHTHARTCIVRQACLTHKPMMPLMPPIPAARHAHGANLANPTDATFFDPCHPSAPCSSCGPSQAPIPMAPNLPYLLCSHHSNRSWHTCKSMHRMPSVPLITCPSCQATHVRTPTRDSKRQNSSYFLETGVDTHAYIYVHIR